MAKLYLLAICFLSALIMRPGKTLVFKENKGQVSDQNYKARPDVLYSANDGKITYHFKKKGLSYQLNKVSKWQKTDKEILSPLMAKRIGDSVVSEIIFYRIDINWLNSNASSIEKGIAEEGYDNYYLEVCSDGVLGVKSYKDITYKNLYKGIDVKWYEKSGSLKYDYIVAPGSDYKQIQFEVNGADKIYLNKNGELVIKTPLGEIVEQKPYVTQNGRILAAKWKIKNNVVSFELKDADPSQPLIIDPLVRLWGTYYGGSLEDYSETVFTDSNNDVYIAGMTHSATFLSIATSGAYQTLYGGTGNYWFGDAFLAKFSPSGNRLWGTYYGGAGSDYAVSGCFGNGTIYIAGGTSSNPTVMTTPGVHQTNYSGGWTDGFIAAFTTAGNRQWGTYLGGIGAEFVFGITAGSGKVNVCGWTSSPGNISTPGSHQTVYGGGTADAFIAQFNGIGNIEWSSYFGGTLEDEGYKVARDNIGNIYMVGTTDSSNPAIVASVGAFQNAYGGSGDGFIIKFSGTGIRQWSTYFGGVGIDEGYSIAIYNNNIFVAGTTSSSGTVMTTPGTHQNINAGGTDSYVAKFDLNGSRIWSTLYGGNGTEDWSQLSVDATGIYLSGLTSTSGGTAIATPCTYEEVYNGGQRDCFLAKLNDNGSRIWGTYYGGGLKEITCSNTIDQNGFIYLVGGSNSPSNIADINSHQSSFAGGPSDAFLVKFSPCTPATLPNTTAPPDMTICYEENTNLTTTLSSCGIQWMDAPNGNVIGTNSVLTTPTLSSNTTYYVQDISCGPGGPLTAIEVTVNPYPNVSVVADSIVCSGASVSLSASGASSYTWLPAQSNSSVLNVNPQTTSTYTVYGFDGACTNSAVATVSAIAYPVLNLQYPHNPQCNGSEVNLTVSGAEQYFWSPSSLLSSSTGSSVTSAPLTSAASFSVIGVNSLGTVSCSTQSTLNISVLQPLIVTVSPSVDICEGSQTALYVNGGNTWQWYGQNISDPSSFGVMVSPFTSGVYSVEASYNYVCPVTATVYVKVNPKPYLFAGNDTTINIGDNALIHAESNGQVTWITGDFIPCRECASSIVHPFTKTCYIAEAVDQKGCRSHDEVCVDVINDYNIYIPNTFTPDGDCLNDIFSIFGYGIKEYSLSIYNRWGDLLFSTDTSQGWDGKFKGKICEDGVYIYKADIMPIKGKLQQRAGHVNLLSGK